MSFKKYQSSNEVPPKILENVQPKFIVGRHSTHSTALPPALQEQPKVTTRIKKRGYKQQSASIVHTQEDGQIQHQQKTQSKTIHLSHEKHSDGTEHTNMRQDPAKTTITTNSVTSRQALNNLQQKLQENASTLPGMHENSLQVPENGSQLQQAIAPASRLSQKPRKKLVAEQKQVNVHIEERILSETFTKLPTQPSIQNVQQIRHGIISPQQPILPISNNKVVTRQPLPCHAAATTEEICQQKRGIDIQHEIEMTGKANDTEYLSYQIDQYQEEQIIREHRKVISTADGDYEHVILVEGRRVIHEAIRQLYIDAQNEDELIDDESMVPTDEDPAVNPSSFERCIDIFCQSFSCNCSNPFSRQTQIITKNDIMTPILRRGRAKGLNLLKQLSFPFVVPGWRIVWIIIELLLAIVSIGLSVSSYVKGSQDVFNLVHLVLASVSTVLALIDGCYSLPNSWKIWRQEIRKKKQKQKLLKIESEHEPKEEKDEHDTYQKDRENQPLLEPTSEDSSCCCKCRWCNNLCCNCIEKFSDLVRTILSEVILVPLLLCDIFEFITSLPKFSADGETIVGIILFAFGLIGIVLYVYIIRIAILCGIVHYVRKARRAFITDPAELKEAKYDPDNAKNALRFQIFFLLHVIGQMVVQVLMFITVGRNIYLENQHLYKPDNTDESIHVSPQLWYMLTATTVLPVFGFFTFFIVANYWVQQFPIALCLDLIKALKMPGAEELFDLKSIAEDGALKVRSTIFNFVRAPKLEDQYKKLQNRHFSTKFAYPFHTPGMFILCCLYFVAQLAFAYIAVPLESSTQSGGSFGWLIFYFIAGIVGFIFNIYSFLVSLAWFFLIFFFTITIIPAILLYLFSILCCANTTS